MASAAPVEDDYITPEEYLALELASPERHEYAAGSVYAMSGTTSGHGRIIRNIMSALDGQLRGKRCEAFSSEIKVRVGQGEEQFYYYPDVYVECGNPPNESLFAEEPRVIFEVLSPGTMRADRHEKRLNYQRLDSLDVYVLVDQARVAVTIYRRIAGSWIMEVLREAQEILDLPTVGCALSLVTMYERTGLVR